MANTPRKAAEIDQINLVVVTGTYQFSPDRVSKRRITSTNERDPQWISLDNSSRSEVGSGPTSK